MFARLKIEFSRYFFMPAPANSYAKTFYEIFGVYSKHRDRVSEIISGRVYLTNLPQMSPLKKAPRMPVLEKAEAALVISSIDISELATSPILLEPDAPQIKYHVLAMQDATGVVGSIDQIFETLDLMSQYADAQKPILIHCYSGVGRSAMMTAMHIAHRYLQNDKAIKALVDEIAILDINSSQYIKELYDAVSKLVLSKRDCCQFDSAIRNDLAVNILTQLNHRILTGQANIPTRDEDYQFLAALVQTRECKSLQYYFYYSMQSRSSYVPGILPAIAAQLGASTYAPQAIDPKKYLQQFFDDFLMNKEGWYQELFNATRNEQSESLVAIHPAANQLEQFCNFPASDDEEKRNFQISERRQLISGILAAITQLAARFPHATYSQQVLASLELQAGPERLGLFNRT